MLVLGHESVHNIYTTGFLHGTGQVDVKLLSHKDNTINMVTLKLQVSNTNVASALWREEESTSIIIKRIIRVIIDFLAS